MDKKKGINVGISLSTFIVTLIIIRVVGWITMDCSDCPRDAPAGACGCIYFGGLPLIIQQLLNIGVPIILTIIVFLVLNQKTQKH